MPLAIWRRLYSMTFNSFGVSFANSIELVRLSILVEDYEKEFYPIEGTNRNTCLKKKYKKASSSDVSSVINGRSSSMRAITSLYLHSDSIRFIILWFNFIVLSPKVFAATAGDVFDGFDNQCC